jgi:chromosome segregation ATPase
MGAMESKESNDSPPATMAATTSTRKVDEGTSARESKRIKLIPSEVDAETQEFYFTRLTETQKLDMMEQGHQEQKQEIRTLKLQLAASAGVKQEHEEQGREIQKLKSQIAAQTTRECQEIQELKTQLAASAEKTSEACKAKEATASEILSLKSQLAASTEKRRKDQETNKTAAEAVEDYKQRLENAHRKQALEIRDLKSQLTTSTPCETVGLATKEITDLTAELAKAISQVAESQKSVTAGKAELDKTRLQLIECQKSTSALTTGLEETKWLLEESQTSCALITRRALEAEWEYANLKRHHGAKLKEALNAANSFMEIGFRKMWATKLSSAPSYAVKRRSATFFELAKMGLKSDTLSGRKFEYRGRKITEADHSKTLSQVSSQLLETGFCGRLTNACVLAWF